MSALSDYLEQKLLDYIFNGDAFASPDTYIALFTSDPGDDGSGTEVSGGSYARVQVNPNGGASPAWNQAVVDGDGHLVDNGADIEFPTATASWGTVTHMGIFDAATAGNLLWHGPLTASKAVGSGDSIKLSAGDLDLKLE